MIRPGDTIYGWIKVTGINFLTFTVQEFACTMNSTGIGKKSSFSRIFPNPANDFLRIESPGTDGEILVYNLLGEEIMRKKSISQHTSIDFRDMPHGLYLIRLMNGNIVETHTFIKR
jgi:hypothetical protein